MEKHRQFLLVLLFSSEIIFSVVSTPFPVHSEEKANHAEEVTNSIANANVTKVVNETKLLGHGDSCKGDECDSAKSLTCSEFGSCECNPHASSELFYSQSKLKCVEEVDSSQEIGGGSWEDDDVSEVHDEDMPDTFPSMEDTAHEDSHQHDEVDKKTTNSENDESNKIKKEVDETGGILGAGVGNSVIPQPCSNDTHCRAKFGNYSRCIVNTGSCECYDTESSGSQNRSTILVNGICYINRTINDACQKHTDCHPTIKGEAWCATDLSTNKKTCQCELLHYWDTSFKECLQLGRRGLESKCKTDYQCAEENALGPLSRCEVSTGKCECYDRDNPTVYYDDTKRCYIEKSLRSLCEGDKDCEASLGMNAFCGNHTDIQPQEKVCQCMEGQSCVKELQERPGISTYTMIVFIVAGIAMLIGIVLCFVLRRNDRYTVVSQTP